MMLYSSDAPLIVLKMFLKRWVKLEPNTGHTDAPRVAYQVKMNHTKLNYTKLSRIPSWIELNWIPG